jgi:hypothetical protein
VRTCAPIEAAVERLAGDPERARATLAGSLSVLEQMRDWIAFVSQAAALADALLALGQDEAAEQWLRRAEPHERRDDIFARLDVGAVRARLLAASGSSAAAEAVASETVELAGQTDALNKHAAALLALADVLQSSEAAAAAKALYDAKENVAASASIGTDAATHRHDTA